MVVRMRIKTVLSNLESHNAQMIKEGKRKEE